MSASTHALVLLNADGDSGIVIAHCATSKQAVRLYSDIKRIAQSRVFLVVIDGVIASQFPIGKIVDMEDLE